jgi:hypothetical protein
VLNLVGGSIALIFLVKAHGYITGFGKFTDFGRSMCIVPDIKKISCGVVRCLLFGTLSWTHKLPMGEHHYALAYREL